MAVQGRHSRKQRKYRHFHPHPHPSLSSYVLQAQPIDLTGQRNTCLPRRHQLRGPCRRPPHLPRANPRTTEPRPPDLLLRPHSARSFTAQTLLQKARSSGDATKTHEMRRLPCLVSSTKRQRAGRTSPRRVCSSCRFGTNCYSERQDVDDENPHPAVPPSECWF